MVIAIQNPPKPPQIDSCLPPLTHSTDDLAVSSTSVHSSNSTITETKNDDFLHDIDDRSRRFSENNSKHHQAVAEKSNQEPVSNIFEPYINYLERRSKYSEKQSERLEQILKMLELKSAFD